MPTKKTTSLFDIRKRRFEALDTAFVRAVNEGRCPPMEDTDTLCREHESLLSTAADTLADVVYKLETAIGEVDEVGGEGDSLALLKRALVALQAGSLATAIRALNKALNGETDYEFAYLGAVAALADLQRIGNGSAKKNPFPMT
ncbi:MAG: hypothetical protein RKP20_06565 [Candidatus Competibacter sp.]|nr:hypothetical protein [Candidatus Competibacter sp.]